MAGNFENQADLINSKFEWIIHRFHLMVPDCENCRFVYI
jgi:hypothetical protein